MMPSSPACRAPAPPQARSGQARAARSRSQAGAGRGASLRRPQRARRDHRARRRQGSQRVHQFRSDRVPLLAPLQQTRALGDTRGGPFHQPRFAGVLQREGRDHGGAADGREPAHRASCSIDSCRWCNQASMVPLFVIGWMSDLEAITRRRPRAWFAKYYRARNSPPWCRRR